MAPTDAPLSGAPLTRPTSISQIRCEYDAFLYASVEEQSGQQMLSVLSALARLDIDPWQEAAKLSCMARDKAAWRLASLIETLPGEQSGHRNMRAAATRLIALLPRQVALNVPSPEPLPSAGIPANVRSVMTPILLSMLFAAFFLVRQHAEASRPPTPQAMHAQSPAINSVKPPGPSLPSGK